MNEKLSKEDDVFLNQFFLEDLTEEKMKALDEKLENPTFKIKYNERLEEEFRKPKTKLLLDYLPLIIMVLLIVLGVYLWTSTI